MLLYLFLSLFNPNSFAISQSCIEAQPQSFLTRQHIINAQDPKLAQERSINYRFGQYGHLSPALGMSINPFPVSSYVEEGTFFNINIKMNKLALKQLKCVENAIQKNCDINYIPENLSTLRERNTYRGGEISNHMFGLAIDIDPAINPCCGCVPPWSDHPSCRDAGQSPYDRVQFPRCWIEQFSRFGFYWLGLDPMQDTMHFEFLAAPPTFSQCPAGMIEIGKFCIDQYEAPNKKGEKPFVARNALEGEKWCKDQGKELCSDIQWQDACEGQAKNPFPYGKEYKKSQCNDDKQWRIVNWALVAGYNPENPNSTPQSKIHVDHLNQTEASENRAGCRTQEGVYDLTGNAAEWVRNERKRPSQANGTIYGHNIKGCFWSKCYKNANPSCAFTNSNHASSFRSYETGFRCCKKLID
jgi:hypothetical protein